MNRRGFFGNALVSATTALAVRLGRSNDAVPRRVDVRKEWTNVPVDIWLDGRKQNHVVAYDLDAGTIVRYRMDPNGDIAIAPHDQWVTERGVLVVRWQEAR